MSKLGMYTRDLLQGRLWYRAVRRWGRDRGSIFTAIYRANYWNSEESRSGWGSTLEATAKARVAIEAVVREKGIRSMLDAPCGDFNWMRHTRLDGVSYTGADIVPDLAKRNQAEFGSANRKFIRLDIVEEVPQAYDLILCRDCVQHLTNAETSKILKNFSRSGSKYLLMTMSPRLTENGDMPKAGGFRGLNLRLAPFNLPEPEMVFPEHDDESPNLDKHLGLWKLPFPGYSS